MKIKDLLSDKSKWTKQAWARDNLGNGVLPLSSNAVCWCLSGLIIKCYPEYMHFSLFASIRNEIIHEYYTGVMSWNDAPERTFEHVKNLVDKLNI